MELSFARGEKIEDLQLKKELLSDVILVAEERIIDIILIYNFYFSPFLGGGEGTNPHWEKAKEGGKEMKFAFFLLISCHDLYTCIRYWDLSV